jgi:low affinity Fe/Cu permease
MSKELTPGMPEYQELMRQLDEVNNLVLSKLTAEEKHEERLEEIRERNEDHAQKYGGEPINPEADIDIPAIDDELGI